MITSLQNTMIKELMKLKQKKYRESTGYYLVEGEHLVKEALASKQAICIVTTKPLDCEINTYIVSKEVMNKLSFTVTSQAIIAKCKRIKQQEILTTNRYLLLDNLQDPGNVGTLIRSALSFGIKQVILSPNSVDIYNDKVLRSMQGANFYLSCVYKPLEEVIPYLQKQQVQVIGSALKNARDIKTINKSNKMAYIVGNEGNGMHQSIMDICDDLAYIPITTMESLNVGIAGSIMMYHFMEDNI
jgi:TrmH family RNA methyltransferase